MQVRFGWATVFGGCEYRILSIGMRKFRNLVVAEISESPDFRFFWFVREKWVHGQSGETDSIESARHSVERVFSGWSAEAEWVQARIGSWQLELISIGDRKFTNKPLALAYAAGDRWAWYINPRWLYSPQYGVVGGDCALMTEACKTIERLLS